jgi:GNAT superfamily N-acetyltransferase
MTQDYDIRRAAPSDMDAILSFQRAAIAAVPEDFYPRAVRDAWMRMPASGLPDLIAAGRYYVAAKEGVLVAGAGWQPHDSEPDAAAIRGVFVHPRCKTRGVGRRIMRAVEDAAVTAGFIRILVPSAPNATGFYEKLGYHASGTAVFELDGLQVGICKMWKNVA